MSVKGDHRTIVRRYFQLIYLVKVYYLKYWKNSFKNQELDKETNRK